MLLSERVISEEENAPMENTPTRSWWRTPAVIAAIIGAVAVIIAAIIGLMPKSKSQKIKVSEPTRIEQNLSGSGNVQIGQGRDVDVKIDGQNTQKK